MKPIIAECYFVEKIIGKKVENGVTTYHVVWEKGTGSGSSWEPESNLNCEDMIDEYESNERNNKYQNLIPEAIAGVTKDENNNTLFLVKWQGLNKIDLLPIDDVKTYYPQTLIKFYEDNYEWSEA